MGFREQINNLTVAMKFSMYVDTYEYLCICKAQNLGVRGLIGVNRKISFRINLSFPISENEFQTNLGFHQCTREKKYRAREGNTIPTGFGFISPFVYMVKKPFMFGILHIASSAFTFPHKCNKKVEN